MILSNLLNIYYKSTQDGTTLSSYSLSDPTAGRRWLHDYNHFCGDGRTDELPRANEQRLRRRTKKRLKLITIFSQVQRTRDRVSAPKKTKG